MAAPTGGPILIFQIIADTTNFMSNSQQVVSTLGGMGTAGQQTTQTFNAVGNIFQNITVKVSGFGGATAQTKTQLEGMFRSMAQLGNIARQIIGMWTSWTVWQIRLTQYENQLREAEQRRDKVIRDITRSTTTLSDGTRVMVSLFTELANAQFKSLTGWDAVERATGNLIIAIGRYGPASEEAKAATLEWTGTLMGWAEAARKAGVSEETIQKAIELLKDSIEKGQIPVWKDFAKAVGLTGDEFDPFQVAALAATTGAAGGLDLVSVGAGLAAESVKGITTAQDDSVKSVEAMQAAYTDSLKDVEASLYKVNEAQTEAKLMALAFGVEIIGVVGSIGLWIMSLGMMSIASGPAAAGTGIFTAGVGALAGSFAGLVIRAIPIIGLIAGIAAIVGVVATAFSWAYNNIEAFRNAVNWVVEGLGKLWNFISGVGQKIADFFGGLFGGAKQEVTTAAGGISEAFAKGAAEGFQVGGVIPRTGRYTMHAGEVVTPEPIAATGGRIGEAESKGRLGEGESIGEGRKISDNIGDIMGDFFKNLFSGIMDKATEAGIEVGETLAKGYEQELISVKTPIAKESKSVAGSMEVGGVIPITDRYLMHAGEVVTPQPVAATGGLIGAAKGGAETGPSEVNYNFGDIHVEVQQLAGEQDYRTVALKLRRHIQEETARTV